MGIRAFSDVGALLTEADLAGKSIYVIPNGATVIPHVARRHSSMKHESYIAKRFQSSGAGLSLDTEALAKYKDIIDLSIGDTDFTTDEAIIKAAFRDAKAGHTHYGDPKGDPELIDAVCRAWEEDFGQRLPRDHVLVTRVELPRHGARDARHPRPRRRGHRLLALLPHVPRADRAGRRRMRGRADLRERGLRHRRSASARRHHARTKAIVFNNPTNPTGMGYDGKTLELLARVAQEHDLLIAADEIYTTYIYEGDFCPIRTLPGMAERTITLNSFSKNFLMTGWRVGVIIAEPELLAVMNRINGSLIYSAPSVSQRAAIQALAMRKEIREKYVTAYRDRIFYAADRIEKLPT